MEDGRLSLALPRASLVQGLRFTAQVIVPNVVQGLFRRRRRAVAAAAKLDADGQAASFVRGLARAHGGAPLWVRVAREEMLLVLSEADTRRVLEGSPEPFAPDPDAKRKGMAAFQPDALTISRGELWRNRRAFTEAVLDTGKPEHRLSDRFAAVAREEAAKLPDEIDWDTINRAFQRIARRLILGDAAADDEELYELLGKQMDAANGMPDEVTEDHEPFMARVRSYVEAAEPGSLTSLFADAPSDEQTNPPGQVVHWLFALGDTLPANALRALALLATHPLQRARADEEGERYLEACLQEAMRLFPTTPLLSRETIEPTEWEGETVPSGTQILISNLYAHRDRGRFDYADRFAPEAWTEGDAGESWAFNHFSHGPQGCPGAGMALAVGTALLAELLGSRDVSLLEREIDPDEKLPAMLDFFALRIAAPAVPDQPAWPVDPRQPRRTGACRLIRAPG